MGVLEVFPTTLSLVVCCGYIATAVLQGILTVLCQHDGRYEFNVTTGVMAAEVLKLVSALSIQISTVGFAVFVDQLFGGKRLLLLYFVPAFLYSIGNNLIYISLASLDPTTYYLLLQIRVLVTGTLFQWLFSRRLSRLQWLSLAILTFGCLVKEFGRVRRSHHKSDGVDLWAQYYSTVLVVVQVMCSCFAGVYSEYILKKEAPGVPLMIQNTYMYVDSLVSNLIFMTAHGQVAEIMATRNLQALFTASAAAVVINNAAIGLITSVFVQKLNSVLKVYANSIQLLLTAYTSWLVFGIPVDIFTAISLTLIIVSVYMYSMNPLAPIPANLPLPLPMSINDAKTAMKLHSNSPAAMKYSSK